MAESGMDLSILELGPVTGSGEHNNELSHSVKVNFLSG